MEKERDELQPHLYAIGHKAFKSMCTFKQSQSVRNLLPVIYSDFSRLGCYQW
jgi:hypothetical protein